MIKTLLTAASLSLVLCAATVARADIFEWEFIDPSNPALGKQRSNTLVPDGAGVDAVPGANLRSLDLTKAYLTAADLSNVRFDLAVLSSVDFSRANITNALFIDATLTNANFSQAGLTNAKFDLSTLSGVDFSRADLTNSRFNSATLTNADLTGAEVRGADFNGTNGFTAAQLYSTASYQSQDLTGIGLGGNDLTGGNLAGQNLTNANLSGARLTDSDLSQANLTNAEFWGAMLTNADLTGADVRGAGFVFTTSIGFTAAQLYSTASYQTQDLTRIDLTFNDLTDWDFAGQNLTDTSFRESTLANANLTGAEVRGANFSSTTSNGFTAAQLYSTASYQAQDLTGIRLRSNDLTGWDFAGQNLTNTIFCFAKLTNADLMRADLRGAVGANLAEVVVTNLIRPDGSVSGLNLTGNEVLLVRDYDGNPNATPTPTGPISITVAQQFVMDTGGILQLQFEADPWDSLISFDPGISVTLGGTLELDFAAGVDLASQVGRTLDLFDWTGVAPTGVFTVASPYRWDLSALYSTGEVTLLAVPEPSSSLLLLMAISLLTASRRFSRTKLG